jgi:CheY-like chemotaxis protein
MGGVIATPSPSMRRILRNTLHRFGIDDVQEFPDGPKALEACTRTTSFLITAWSMEGFDGVELARQLRAAPETAHIPILMVTVRNSKDDVLRAREAGISAYMLQPFVAEQFRSKIEMLLDQSVRPTSDSADISTDGSAAAPGSAESTDGSDEFGASIESNESNGPEIDTPASDAELTESAEERKAA